MKKKKDDYIYRILRLSLAFEDYIDNTGSDISELNEAYDCLKLFREKRDNFSEENQEKMLSDLLEKFYNVLDIVGKDKFIIYDDGDINYIWDYSLIKKNEVSK